MQRSWLIAALVVLLAGCRSSTPAPALAPEPPQAAAPPAAPTPPPQAERPGTGSLPIATATAEQLKPFFQSIASQVPGLFVRTGGALAYVDGDHRVELPLGANPVALLATETTALLSDAQRTYWFDWTSGQLTPIQSLPPIRSAVRRSDTYLLIGTGKEALVWTPTGAPTALERPEHLFSVADASLSPDARYAVVVYDLDLPGGPRVSALWTYDLRTGSVFKHPDPVPAVAGGYGIWLLGWSETHTLRTEGGVRDFRGGQTWRIAESAPTPDGTEYPMMEGAVISPDGAWFLYRPIPEQAVIQSIQPDSKPAGLPFPRRGAYDVRILLDGHLAAHDDTGWIEMLPDGSLKRWDGAQAIY